MHCLTSQLNPHLILIQESWLSPENNFYFKNYRSFRLDRPSRGGGIIALISNRICHKAKLTLKLLDPEYEILVISIKFPSRQNFSIANAYFPSGVHDTRPLDTIIGMCGRNFLLAGDFNSHHVTWGLKTDACGSLLWDWSQDNHFTCLNSGSPTYVKDRIASSLDLTFASSSLNISAWSVVDCATNSDHLPITFEIISPVVPSVSNAHKFINYKKFKQSLLSSLASIFHVSTKSKALSISSVFQNYREKAEF